MVLYVTQQRKMSPLTYCRDRLEQLATTPPRRIAALVRWLMPAIEAAMNAGQSLKDVWRALEAEGLQVSYFTFQKSVWRARRKLTAANDWKKRKKAAESGGTVGIGAESVEERDPLANLKRLEENRSGFHWRGTQSLQRLVHGTEDSKDKSKR